MTKPELYNLLKKIRDAEWQHFGFHAYDYEFAISNRIILAAIYGGLEIPMAVARQSGKTTTIVQTIAFLLKYLPEITDAFFAVGFFTPQREQVKTDRDRLVKLLNEQKDVFGYTLPEVNQNTVRITYNGRPYSECYLFSVSPTSHPESKTLNMAIIEESHKINDTIVSNDIRPMLASTNGSFIWTGVAGTRKKHFKKILETSELAFICNDIQIIKDKRKVFEKTGDDFHLHYENFIDTERTRLGEDSIPFKLNYRLEWTLGKGQFTTMENIKSLSYSEKINPADEFEWVVFGVDHARNYDRTWIIAIGKKAEWKLPRIVWIERLPKGMDYDAQADLVLARVNSFTNTHERVVIPDSTGQGDFMGDLIDQKSGHAFSSELGTLLRFKFTSQGKDETATLLKQMFDHGTVLIPDDASVNNAEHLESLIDELLDLELHMNGSLYTWHAPEREADSMQSEPHDDGCASLMLALVGVRYQKERKMPMLSIV